MREIPDEMGDLYHALAQIRDDYLEKRISHKVAMQRIQEARERFKPSWWQDQVMILAIQADYHKRVIWRQWLLIAILCVILVLAVGALVIPVLRLP